MPEKTDPDDLLDLHAKHENDWLATLIGKTVTGVYYAEEPAEDAGYKIIFDEQILMHVRPDGKVHWFERKVQ